jgi:hypothetical protein
MAEFGWMRSWPGGVAGLLLCAAAPGGAAGVSVDCGPTPTAACLSAAIFSLAKALPDDDPFREYVGFAERELAGSNLKTALDYIVTDAPDAPPWMDIEWIAQAGRFDRAIEVAKQREAPVERLGGLLAVASHLLDRNDRERATRIVDEVERGLPSLPIDDDSSGLVRNDTAEILVRLGQTDRAMRLIGNGGSETVDILLTIAGKDPQAQALREEAWRAAERGKELYAYQLLLEDAIRRGDPAEISQAAQRVSGKIDGTIDSDHADSAISLARVLLEAGAPDQAARMVKSWPRWVDGKDVTHRENTLCSLLPVLAGLAQDREVETAAQAVSNVAHRGQCLSKAADEYLRLGRTDVAEKFDVEVMRLAVSSPTGEPKLQWEHNAALHNLALDRAGRGDIQGALDAAGELRDEIKVREVMFYIVRRAIDSGHGPVAGPAILAAEHQAVAARDAGMLLQVARDWYDVGDEEGARRNLAEVTEMAKLPQSSLAAADRGLAAELMWRISGKSEAILDIVDQLQVNDRAAIDHLVEVMSPISPAVAVRLTGRQVALERRINELATIALQIAEAAK